MNSTSSSRPWQFYLTASLLAAAATVWLSPPSSPIALVFVSLAVGGAGASAAALHAVLAALGGRVSRDVAVSDGVRAGLEREKLLALRAIKDLQFDMAMRKISAADAAPMEARLRERAADIIRQLDGRDAVRARVEKDIAERQARDQRPEAIGIAAAICAACSTANDADAKFCKNCGAKL